MKADDDGGSARRSADLCPQTPGDRARVTVFVAVSPDRAFSVFTRETDLWWRRGPRFRFGGARRGTLTFEPGGELRIPKGFTFVEKNTAGPTVDDLNTTKTK